MDTKAIVGYLISDIVTRPEYFALAADLDKCNRLRPTDKFHHVTFLFPAVESSVKSWSAQVGRLYTDCGLEFEASWNHPVGNQLLLVFLHTKPRAMMGT